MKTAVALIVAAGLSTMAYALPEQRAMAHHLISSDPSDASDADVIPFGQNNPDPGSKSDPPANTADPPPTGTGPPPGAGPPFGPNCVGCISTQNLANGAVTTPKIAPGAVTLKQIVRTNVTTIPANTLSVPVTVFCPSNTIATGGGFDKQRGLGLTVISFVTISNAPIQGWEVIVSNPTPSPLPASLDVICTSTAP